MKPFFKLSEGGQEIFDRLLCLLPENVLQDVDNYELSMLADQFAIFAEASENINQFGYKQTTHNGYSQITADVTVKEKAAAYIIKNSSKFGLNPDAREKLKEVWAKKAKKKSKIGELV